MTDPPIVRVVFIGGYARTGSTLLDRLLGQIDGFASMGEMRHIWERSFLGDQLCGCGERFHRCPFWAEVAEDAFGGFEQADPRAVSLAKRATDSFWNIPRIASGGWPAPYRLRLAEYAEAVRGLYVAIQRVSGARFLVDSTKDMQHAYLLRSLPGFDLRLVHLIRDSRAVAFSWRRTRRRPEIFWERRDMPRFPAVRTAFAWNAANIAAGAFGRPGSRYVRVRYEDLVRDPREELARIADGLGLGPVELGFIRDGVACLEAGHTVAGNPMRFRSGPVEIRPDEEWRGAIDSTDHATVTALTWPLLRRYGYTGLAGGVAGKGRRTPQGPRLGEMARTARLAFAAGSDPVPFARSVSGLLVRYLESRGIRIQGRWLDVGTGPGTVPESLARAGAVAVGLDVADRRRGGVERTPFVLGTAEGLPFASGAFDGVICSNVLEHVPHPWPVIDELVRACRPGGTICVSWTNWYSPFGGHEWSPFHYLGPRLGVWAYRVLRGRLPSHLPGRTLFPVHVGQILEGLPSRPMTVVDVAPRYWPSLRVLARVPGLREVAMWNCVVLLRKAGADGGAGPA